jgi:hypothetical protein
MTDDDLSLTHSEQISEIVAALLKVQATEPTALKQAENPHLRSKYADLEAVMSSVRPALTANGVLLIQAADVVDGRVGVTTLLVHVSGQWFRSRLLLTPTKNDPQAIGSCITYGRRYGLSAMAGVVTEDDDAERGKAPEKKLELRAEPADSPTRFTINGRQYETGGITKGTLLDLWAIGKQLDKETSKGTAAQIVADIAAKEHVTELTEAEAQQVRLAFIEKRKGGTI